MELEQITKTTSSERSFLKHEPLPVFKPSSDRKYYEIEEEVFNLVNPNSIKYIKTAMLKFASQGTTAKQRADKQLV